jgi:ribonuclease III
MAGLTETRPADALLERLGHGFRDADLFALALTHRSAVPASDAGHRSYQRLEFLGDRVLALVVSDMLLAADPRAEEGELARRLNMLVRRETCAEMAASLGVGPALRLGAGERRTGGRTNPAILGDVMEALIAAVYLDAGFDAARALVERLWRPRLAALSGPLRDAKTTLQEWAQGRGLPTPTYAERARSGPDHAPEFTVAVRIGDEVLGEGRGKSKREAEQAAAAVVLAREGLWEPSR